MSKFVYQKPVINLCFCIKPFNDSNKSVVACLPVFAATRGGVFIGIFSWCRDLCVRATCGRWAARHTQQHFYDQLRNRWNSHQCHWPDATKCTAFDWKLTLKFKFFLLLDETNFSTHFRFESNAAFFSSINAVGLCDLRNGGIVRGKWRTMWRNCYGRMWIVRCLIRVAFPTVSIAAKVIIRVIFRTQDASIDLSTTHATISIFLVQSALAFASFSFLDWYCRVASILSDLLPKRSKIKTDEIQLLTKAKQGIIFQSSHTNCHFFHYTIVQHCRCCTVLRELFTIFISFTLYRILCELL